MIDKAVLEQFLRINGIQPTASDEEIKSVLLSAEWHEEDVNTAMLILRENVDTHESHVDSLHKVFRSDERLAPDSVSQLLGINMDASQDYIRKGKQAVSQHTMLLIVLISLITFALAVSFIAGSMWVLGVGPFHQTQLVL